MSNLYSHGVGRPVVFVSNDNKSGLSADSSSHLKKVLRLRDQGRHLLLGRNGCGKTTLLKAIASGELPGWPRNLSAHLVDQELRMDPALSPLEFVCRADLRMHSLHQEVRRLEAECAGTSEDTSASARLGELYSELSDMGAETEGEWRNRAQSLLRGLGFEEFQTTEPLAQLSGGWRMRVAIAAALFVRPRLLMLDEPTNHLDLGAIDWLQRHLVDEYKGTVLCVSHDRDFINEVCTDIIIFADQSLTYFHGTLDLFEEAAQEKARHLEKEASALERKREAIQQTIQHKEREVAKAEKNKSKNKAKSKYAILQGATEGKSMSGLVAAQQQKLERLGMERTEDGKKFKASEHGNRAGSIAENEGGWVDGKMTAAPLLHGRDPGLRFGFTAGDGLRIAEGTPLLQLRNVSYTYPGSIDPALVDVDLSIAVGSHLALQGQNGAGKSTLVKLICGDAEPTAGEVWRHQSLKVSILRQHDTDSLANRTSSAMEYMAECYPKMKDLELRKQLGAFGVAGDLVFQSLSTLSGGQRMRVLFAKICMEHPQLLVLDEPTNHLDIYSIEALSVALAEFRGAVLLITHNRDLLRKVAKELYVISKSQRRLSLVSRALPGGPLLEVPAFKDLSPRAQKPRCTEERSPKKRFGQSPSQGATEPSKEVSGYPGGALPPWLRPTRRAARPT